MTISNLTLAHFRNHTAVSLTLHPQLTVMVGENARGKTNILEALYLLATGDSFRAEKIEEMVEWGAEAGHVIGKVEGRETDELMVTVTRGSIQGKRVPKRLFKVNGAGKRKQDFVGHITAVLFRPEDMDLLTGNPTKRRRFLDDVLIQVDREYARSLLSYEKGLKQRNKLLDFIREGKVSRSALLFWDQLLVKEGTYITEKREALLLAINNIPSLAGTLRVEYDRSPISPERLAAYAEAEVAAGYTLVGPHKDDFMVVDGDNRDLALYGSRGEQRMAVLWLKEAQLDYMDHLLGSRPLLLLDDILSELDQKHSVTVTQLAAKQQTVVTTTDIDSATLFTMDKQVIELNATILT